MHRSTWITTWLACLLAWAGPAAALGTAFTYQGELRDAGQAAIGNYDFRYRLYDAAAGGNQLGAAVELPAQPLDDGLFAHEIDFGDQFTGAPRWLAIEVRRAGQGAYTALLPRRPVTPAPYALHAEYVADDSVLGANIVDRSITAVDVAIGAISGNEIANGSIQALDLADASVTEPKLAPAAVTTSRLADAAVTAAKLAPGAVGAAAIDASQVQRALGGRCSSGFALLGYDASAAPICDDVLNLLGGAARYPRLAMRQARPAVVAIDPGQDDLLLFGCETVTCDTGVRRRVLDQDVGNSSSVALAQRGFGFPFVAYHDAAATDLHAFDCLNLDCSTSNFRSLDTTGDTGYGVDVAVRSDGSPVISYITGGPTPALRLYTCANAGCSSGTARTLGASEVSVATRTALVLTADDVPVVFFGGTGASAGVNAFTCSSPACTLGFSGVVAAGTVAGIDAVIRSNGRSLVSYTVSGGGVRLLDCSGASCTSSTVRTLAAASSDSDTSIALRSADRAVVAFNEASQLKVYDCADAGCSSGAARVLAAGPDLEGEVSIALASDGRVVLASSYADDGTVGVRLDACGNPGCAQ